MNVEYRKCNSRPDSIPAAQLSARHGLRFRAASFATLALASLYFLQSDTLILRGKPVLMDWPNWIYIVVLSIVPIASGFIGVIGEHIGTSRFQRVIPMIYLPAIAVSFRLISMLLNARLWTVPGHGWYDNPSMVFASLTTLAYVAFCWYYFYICARRAIAGN